MSSSSAFTRVACVMSVTSFIAAAACGGGSSNTPRDNHEPAPASRAAVPGDVPLPAQLPAVPAVEAGD